MSRFFETLLEVSRSQIVPASIPEKKEHAEQAAAGAGNFPLVDLPDIPNAAMPGATPPVELRREFVPPLPPTRTADGVAVTTVQLNVDQRTPLMPHTLDQSIVEQYRKLRTKIQQQHATQPIRSLLIASPGAGEGKTVTVINLALSFAMLPDFKVLVIDGDLRKGTVGKWLGTHTLPGLSNLIEGSAKPENVIFKSQDFPLYVRTNMAFFGWIKY